MRLIDIDKHFKTKEVFYAMDLKVPLHEVKEVLEHTPTVNAIPYGWIAKWLTKQTIPATSYGLDCSAVEKMLEEWEKENDKDSE